MKHKNIFISVIVVLLTLFIGIYLGYLLGNKDNKKDYEDFIFMTNDEVNSVKEVSNGYEITLNNRYELNLYDYVDDIEEYKNININGFKLDGIESSLKIENLTRVANCTLDEIYPVITLNGKVLEEFLYEACYLIFPARIFIIEEKYIGILYYITENMEHTLVIYNKDGQKEYERDILEFNLETFTFKDYEEHDPNYYINEYKLVKRNNKVDDIMLKESKEQFCDMMNGIGVCEE